MKIALVRAYPTESSAWAAVAAFPSTEPVGEYRGIWRVPAPYGGIVHMFSDEPTEALTDRGWSLVSSALPGDADATFLLDQAELDTETQPPTASGGDA